MVGFSLIGIKAPIYIAAFFIFHRVILRKWATVFDTPVKKSLVNTTGGTL
jgi:hypothetical protein